MKKPTITAGARPNGKDTRNERASVPLHVRNLLRLQRQKNSHPSAFEIPSHARILIIEGISGSGKDTFQAYLREKLKGRDIYDFSEGELLHSWKHFPIPGILKLRVSFLTQFVKYLRATVDRDQKAVFLLNRFHLSTYITTVLREPELRGEYEELIDTLRTLPVHVFILQVDEHDIDERTLHYERSSTWRKVQRQMLAKDGFANRLSRYAAQQQLMIETAEIQGLPFSVVKLGDAEADQSHRRRLKSVSDAPRVAAHAPRKI